MPRAFLVFSGIESSFYFLPSLVFVLKASQVHDKAYNVDKINTEVIACIFLRAKLFFC